MAIFPKAHLPSSIRNDKALNTYVKLVRAAESVTRRIHQHLASVGLTVSQFGILEALFHLGPLSQKALGQKILKSSGNICTVIRNLEKRSLVKRRRLKTDRRVLHVSLTNQGQDLISTLFPRHRRCVQKEMQILSEKELDHLGSLCRKLGRQDI